MKKLLILGAFALPMALAIGVAIRLIITYIPDYVWAGLCGIYIWDKVVNQFSQRLYQKTWLELLIGRKVA